MRRQIPGNLFWWKGIDGSRVLDYRIPVSYNDEHISVGPQLRETINELKPQPLRDGMDFFGMGDHGGGPTKANMASIERFNRNQERQRFFTARQIGTLRKCANRSVQTFLNLTTIYNTTRWVAIRRNRR